MKKHRHRILGAVLFVLYLVLLTYFLFFAEEMGRSPDARAEYSYNLTLFKEIRRFLLYRNILGWRAVFLNIFGNVLAFMPFGFFLPVIWVRTRHWYITVLLSFAMSLLVETMQLVGKVGSFDVDDLLLNTIGGFAGYSFVATGLAAAALVFYAAAISFSYYTQGNAPLAAAALGFCSIIIAVSSVVYGVFAMMEKEKNYLLAKISLAAAGILLLVWVLMIVFAL